jgi:hypothetical protein
MIARLAVRWSGFVLLSLVSACAGVNTPEPPPPAPAPAATTPPPAPPPAAPPAPTRQTPIVPSPSIQRPTTTAPAPASAANAPAPKVSPPTPAATVAKKESALPPAKAAAAKSDAAPSLDLKSLEQRLRATPAIGAFTKIALKNQVDDLTGKFREYHEGRSKAKLQDLRQPYELLLMKVLSLLQDDDPALANEIARSREVLWSILSDKTKFTQI